MNKKNRTEPDDKENNEIEIEYIIEKKKGEESKKGKPDTEGDEKNGEETIEKSKNEIEELKKAVKQYEEENKQIKTI